jgi:molybdopterin-containing oxidoreductase family iron-sulfur binding subunit
MKLTGKQYWRSLEQLADTDQFKEFLHREFPKGTTELVGKNNWSRRSFLTTMGASLALAGLSGCRRPVEKIVPYVTRPEEVEPGVPNYYATTMPLGLSAYGVVVTSHEGRPTFIAGNELHPSSMGAVNPLVQASLLDLYDPDRSKSVLKNGRNSSWDDFVAWWQEQYQSHKDNQGEGLAVLSETFNSPTLARLKREFLQTFPRATWVSWEPVSDENIYRGIESATRRLLQPVYDYSKAEVVLSLDCDFLGTESESITNSLGFAEARKVHSQSDDMNRLYVIEPKMTVTGMMADHRLRASCEWSYILVEKLVVALKSKGLELASQVAKGLDELVRRSETYEVKDGSRPSADKWIDAVADDLLANRDNSLVVAGRRQPAHVHALVTVINEALGNIGQTIAFHAMPDASPSDSEAFADLTHQISSGQIETLITLSTNTAYASGLNTSRVKNRVLLGTHADESSRNASWHVPLAHYLESWGDARSADGTASMIQPQIAPLHGGKSSVELAELFASGEPANAYESVRQTWRSILPRGDFEKNWHKVLHDGVLPGAVLPVGRIQVLRSIQAISFNTGVTGTAPTEQDMEVCFYVSQLFDGRFANNGWLQELPDPVTKLTWDNVALMSSKTATELGVENEDVVEVSFEGHSLKIPVWISPGQAEFSIAIALGYGRTAAGRVGSGVGANTYNLRTKPDMWFARGATVRKTGKKYELACTQDHGSMEGRPIIRENTLAGYKDKAEFYPKEIEHPEPKMLWNEHKYDQGYQWGMVIDLNSCTGCNACVTACQNENNIPVIGKNETRNGREMHWMRLDRYYAGDADNPEVAVQPMNCQHCENAPCEQVCPVAATTHDSEGLNVMVYNRCIGTRYCSNNCPYKVRRFNFYNYTSELPETIRMAQNPEVTVRFRGVMEKCTYCTQRITQTKIKAKNQGRSVADSEITTACESACPARAITFGNINDPDSRVAKLKANNRNYRVLEELNIRPRTSYLAKLRNPNPALSSEAMSENEKNQTGS